MKTKHVCLNKSQYHALRGCLCSFLVGLLLWACRLLPLLRLLPQGATVTDHPLHVCTLLHPGCLPLLHDDVTHRGQADGGTRKFACLQLLRLLLSEGVWET